MDLDIFLRKVSTGAIPILFAITFHEVAHGWVAKHFGDRTAESQGRLSLNPIRHIDPVGTVLVPAILLWLGGFMFGWAKPVPVNPRYMRNPRPNMVWVTAAGPSANILMAIVWAALIVVAENLSLGVAGYWLLEMAEFGLWINVLLAVFNMLPIPPLDGGQLLINLLPHGPVTRALEAIQPWGFFILIGLIATKMLGPLIIGPVTFLLGLIGSIFGLGIG